MQRIRPAHEKFKSEIRRTAPEFRPFEKRFAGRVWKKAKFLMNEEGGANDTDDIAQGCKIYIDEVLQRAHQ
jgi:hypothetical protein